MSWVVPQSTRASERACPSDGCAARARVERPDGRVATTLSSSRSATAGAERAAPAQSAMAVGEFELRGAPRAADAGAAARVFKLLPHAHGRVPPHLCARKVLLCDFGRSPVPGPARQHAAGAARRRRDGAHFHQNPPAPARRIPAERGVGEPRARTLIANRGCEPRPQERVALADCGRCSIHHGRGVARVSTKTDPHPLRVRAQDSDISK